MQGSSTRQLTGGSPCGSELELGPAEAGGPAAADRARAAGRVPDERALRGDAACTESPTPGGPQLPVAHGLALSPLPTESSMRCSASLPASPRSSC
mmetsp:Transcript_7919/g.24064  ORF Transcript_7919/g.24064 Transcript_7919/m.24064 type:complete len:96 (-) Transcript_7919:153-440(-)